jgi:hypothetical protein
MEPSRSGFSLVSSPDNRPDPPLQTAGDVPKIVEIERGGPSIPCGITGVTNKSRKEAAATNERYPGAAASLREGLEETLTVTRLGLPELIKTLKSTNAIESAFDKVRFAARNVKRWRNGRQVLYWSAAGLIAAAKGFTRIRGYHLLPLLTAALESTVAPKLSSTVKMA